MLSVHLIQLFNIYRTAELSEQTEKQQETEIQGSDLREQAELDSYTLSQPSFAQNKHAGMAFTHILHDNFFGYHGISSGSGGLTAFIYF